MCLAGSNILEPPMFLDRIAISEIIIKIIYFYFSKSKSFIYENLIFRVALFVDFCTDILSQAYIFEKNRSGGPEKIKPSENAGKRQVNLGFVR